MTQTVEKRMAMTPLASFRTAGDENGDKYFEGYFIRFNEETELWPGYFEQIAPEAIDDNIQTQDIRALFDHDTAKVLGRTSAGTLTLTKDATGVYGKVLVNQDDSEALSIYAKVQRGDVSSASFGFFIDKDDLSQNNDGTTHDIIRAITLLEVSVVTFPAYPTTQIDARKRDIESAQKEQFDAHKRAVKEGMKKKWQTQSL